MINGFRDNGRTEILLVDDNPEAELILKAFRKANIVNRVHVLGEGGEILEFLFRKGRYANEPALPREMLILLALNLRGMSGIDVLRKIKSDERSRNIPVILLAATQEERGVMESYKLGANACIVHPIDVPKIIEAVAELRLGWLLITPEEDTKAK
jgi:two-component system response regulator